MAGTQRRLDYGVWSMREGNAEILSQLAPGCLHYELAAGWVHSSVGHLTLPPELCLNSPATAPR